MTAHEDVEAALETHQEAVQALVAATHRRLDALPREARAGAVLFLLSSLVVSYADDPRRARSMPELVGFGVLVVILLLNALCARADDHET